MPLSSAFSKLRSLAVTAPVLGLAVLLALPRQARAFDAEQQAQAQAKQEGPKAPPQEFNLSEVAGEALGKMKPLADDKNWDAALQALNAVIPKLEAGSYDFVVVTDTKAKILLQLNDYAGAVATMEPALQLAEEHHYFNDTEILNRIWLLAQIYYEESTNEKTYSKEVRQGYLGKAIAYVEEWMAKSPKPDPNISDFYARILYDEALSKNPDKPDPELIKKCQDETEKIIATTLHPKDLIYILLLATLQQQGNYGRAAEILELLVSRQPGMANKAYWLQLEGIYINLAASSDKNPDDVKKYSARAINAIERAQARGFLMTPRDNFNLVTIYYNVGQFEKATELLYAGLKAGTIESTLKNWELLASSYQQISQQSKAVEVLKEAAQDPRFADSGQIDFQIGQMYLELNKTAEAYNYFQAAVKKGGLENLFSVYLHIAYTGFELQKYPEALDAAERAAKLPQAAKDKQLPPVRQAIEEAIKERARQAAAAKNTAAS